MEEKELLALLAKEDTRELFSRADAVRAEYCGHGVHLRGIIEFSNYCGKNCLYCGLRRDNSKIKRYRMDGNEILESARQAAEAGVRTIVLQSGEDPGCDMATLCRVTSEIKKRLNCAVTISIGEIGQEECLMLKDAGADRYLLKFETSDEALFKRMKPDSSYGKRFNCIERLQKTGFQTGSGNIVGLPGQTAVSIVRDTALMEKLDLDMASVSPFIPHPDTPLGKERQGDLILTLKTIALVRIATLNAHIPATTAIGTIDKNGRQKALACGANIVMPNFTPVKYKKHYSIYPGKICITEDGAHCAGCLSGMFEQIGRRVASGYGHSLKKTVSDGNQVF